MTLELGDIQGILLEGYGRLAAASYVLLSFDDPAGARRWLGELEIRPAAETLAGPAVNVALTVRGLAKLGLDEAALSRFPTEVREGMVTDFRKRVLGDVEASDPVRWDWGGPKNPEVHAVLMLYAPSEADLARLVTRATEHWEKCGLSHVATLPTERLPAFKEHFGFRDGISDVPLRGHRGRTAGVAPGEFVLGYPNEYDKLTASPTVPRAADAEAVLPKNANGAPDLGRNGSYLVFRQMSQDVYGFWKWLDERARGDEQRRLSIAAKMVGRWPGGASLVRHPEAEPPTGRPDNDFLFAIDDAAGHRCPLGSHIRRTNPRDAIGHEAGSEALSNLHRLIRRGRAYGKPLTPEMTPQSFLAKGPDRIDRGLHFLCFNANVDRQFEFVQQTWVNSGKFAALRNDPDPLIGARYLPSSQFTIQRDGVRRRLVDLPSFVTVRGGAYFFLPGLTALKYLASLGSD